MSDKKYSEDDLERVAGIVSERLEDRMDLLEENIELIIDKHVRPIVQEELVEVKQDIKIIKTAVKETNKDLHKLEKRVTQLEVA